MAIFDDEGYELDEQALEHGDTVYDETGQEFVFVEDGAGLDVDDTEEGVYYGDEYANEGEYAEIGKGKHSIVNQGIRGRSRNGWARAKGYTAEAGLHQAARGQRAAGFGDRQLMRGAEYGSGATRRVDMAAGRAQGAIGRGRERAGQAVYMNPGRTLAYGGAGLATTGAGTGAVVHARRKSTASKSLGEQVLVELSKAMNEGEREEIIAKAMDVVDDQQYQINELTAAVTSLIDREESMGFAEVAKGYELPVDPDELGDVLKRASHHLSPRDLATLDRVLSASGEYIAKGYDEIGFGGLGGPSNVMDQVGAIAGEAVSKTEYGALTPEQAVVAVFDSNPDAYDEYLQERY
jgi:hypothetical protein